MLKIKFQRTIWQLSKNEKFKKLLESQKLTALLPIPLLAAYVDCELCLVRYVSGICHNHEIF